MRITDHNEEREKIILFAAYIMANEGLQKLTMQHLADYMGVTRGKIMHYFASKDDIVNATFHWANDQVFTRITEASKKSNNIKTIIYSILPLDEDRHIEWVVRNIYRMECLINNEGREERKQIDALRITQLQDIIDKQQQQGLIKPELNAYSIAVHLVDLIAGLASNLLFISIEARTERLFELEAFIESMRVEPEIVEN